MEQAEKDSTGNTGLFTPGASAGTKDGANSDGKKTAGVGGASGTSSSSSLAAGGGAAAEVPYRCIIQGRKEMPLVQLLLKNHAKGEENDYITYKDREGFSLGEK